ncbi:hypothetical protein [Parafrankia sp. BMG5.11]|uniref:hypothetical protein n=1 Tax=Parafrankia sp. BMG5.11 TaxID=222540 RepID=UPI00103BFAE3|nr:hypothetical protein [Parafrankia sp. BMG5.11]TCJ39583.1 hypothetical protein E0504_10820 [Parafrankia sp. BMG5.11]
MIVVCPGGCIGHNPNLEDICDGLSDNETIADLDESDALVGFPVGLINRVTVLEVSSAPGQELVENLDLHDTPRFWTPAARFYLFEYVVPSAVLPGNRLVPGLRLLTDGDCTTYPGNLVDGQLVHWEMDPWAVGLQPLPQELRSA